MWCSHCTSARLYPVGNNAPHLYPYGSNGWSPYRRVSTIEINYVPFEGTSHAVAPLPTSNVPRPCLYFSQCPAAVISRQGESEGGRRRKTGASDPLLQFLIKPSDLVIHKKSISRDHAAKNTPAGKVGSGEQRRRRRRGWMDGETRKEGERAREMRFA